MPFYTYILQCSDGTLYTGYTNNLEQRIRNHNSKKLGAKYTRSRQPVVLMYSQNFKTKSAAMKKECAIKKLSREKKLLFTK